MSEFIDRLQSTLGGAYRVQRELGGGGMSRVFLAEETRLGRKVVVKVLPPDMAAGVNADRFEREIQLAASLQHPHIVQLLTAGASDDLLYYVMPFIEGESLRAKLAREGALPMGEVMRILRDVVDALAYSHRHGVVHRDIKPDNVMLAGKHALVTDFGVAKAVSASSGGGHTSLTSLGIALGTPAYMAPEQAAADPRVDHRADLYAVGALAYEMICGRPPFAAPTPQAMLAAHISERPDPPSKYRSAVPPTMNELVLRCLEKNPADRWQSADEVLGRLEALATPTGGLTPVSTTPVNEVRTEAEAALRKAQPVRVATMFALATLLVVGGAFGLTRLLGLPDWIWIGAAVLMAAGLPIILYTGRVERKRAVALTMGTLRFEPEPAHHGWFTWRRAIRGGWVALGVLVLLTAGFIVSRLTGIGPGRTLLTAGVLGAEDRILLLDFENRTTDSALGRSVTEALRIDLAQSRVMRLVNTSDLTAALQRMGKAPEAEMDLALARDLGQREGIKAIVAGEITTLGAGYVLSARVLSAATGETLIPLRETAADASELIAAVDRLSKALRGKVGESLRSIRAAQPRERVTTASLSALRLYTEGVEASDVGRNEEGARLLRRAVEEDSTFAMAWRKLGVILNRTGQASQAEIDDAVTRAFRLRDRLPPVERYLAEAYYHNTITRDQERSAAAYRAVLDVDPDEPTALNNLSIHLTSVGRADEAEALLRHLVEIRQFQTGYTNLFGALIAQEKDAAADSVLREVKRRWPDGVTALQLEVARETSHRDYQAADSVLRAHARDPRTDPSARLRYAYFKITVAGTLGQLDRMSEEAGALRSTLLTVNPGLALGLEFLPTTLRARLLNRPADGAAAVDSALRRTPLASMPAPDRPFQWIARIYAAAGRAQEVRQFHEQWKQANPEDRRPKFEELTWEGILALSEGRWRDAAQSFDASQAVIKCTPCGLYDAAEAWDRAGEADSAIVRWERVVTSVPTGGEPNEMFELTFAYRRLGELHEAKGNRDKALDYYGRFATLWRSADPELQPQVREVKQRLARLAGERT